MKITREEYKKILEELSNRINNNELYDFDFYWELRKSFDDACYVDILRNQDKIELYKLITFKLLEVNIIKIDNDNKLVLNL